MTKGVNLISISEPVIVLLIGCIFVFCRKNTRLHRQTGLTISVGDVIYCLNRLDKMEIEKSIGQ